MTLFPPRRQGPKPTSPGFKQVLRIHIHTHTRSHGMSLLQRVTSIDGNDLDTSSVHNYNNNNKDQRYGTVRSLRTVISYDILPQPEEDSFATHPTGGVTAYKVSEAQRLGMLCAFLFEFFLFFCFFFASVFVLHLPLLMTCFPMSQSAGHHHHRIVLAGVGNRIRIRSIEARSRGSRRVSRVLFGRRTRVGCRSVLRTGSPVRVLLLGQEELEVAGGKKALDPNHDFYRLNVFFAIASTTCNVSALAVGTILDRYGPRVAGIIGSLSLAAGSALMGSAFAIPEFDGYIVGNILLSLGGTFIFVPSFQVANAFPKWSGTIVAMVTGAFDASVSMTSSPAEQHTVRQLTRV